MPKKPKKRGRPPKGRKRTASPTVEVVVAPKQAAKPWQKSGTAAISLSSDDDDSDGSSWSRAKKKKRSVSPPKEEEEDLEDSLPPPPEINLDFTKRTVERAAARKIVDAAAAPKPTPVEIADDDSDLDLDPDLRDIRAKARPIPSVADRRTLDLKVFYTVLGAENETQESRTFTVPATATILDKYAEILAAFGLNERYEMRFLHARNRVLHSVPFSAMEELQQARRKTSSDKPSGVRLEMMSKNDFEGLTRYMEEERRRKLNPEPVSLDIDDEMDQETEETADNKGEQDVRLSIRFQDNGGEVKMEFRMKVARVRCFSKRSGCRSLTSEPFRSTTRSAKSSRSFSTKKA